MLTTDILISALHEQSSVVDELAGKTSATIGQASTKLKNAMIVFVGQLDQATGASDTLCIIVRGYYGMDW